jgi:hypothetical protein
MDLADGQGSIVVVVLGDHDEHIVGCASGARLPGRCASPDPNHPLWSVLGDNGVSPPDDLGHASFRQVLTTSGNSLTVTHDNHHAFTEQPGHRNRPPTMAI